MLRTRQHAHQRIVPQKIMMHQSGRGMEADQKVTDFRDPPVPRAQRLRELRSLALDKTGTITRGKPVVTDVVLLAGEQSDNLRMAASLAARSHTGRRGSAY